MKISWKFKINPINIWPLKYVIFLFWCSLFASLGNYLYYPLSMFLLSSEDFGIFMSILSLTNIIGFSTSGFSVYINNITIKIKNDSQAIRQMYWYFLKQMFAFSVVIFWLFILLSPLLSEYLRIPANTILLFSLLGIIPMCLLLVTEWIWKWKELFWFLGLNYIVNAYAKLIIWWILMFCGFGIYAAVGWLVFGSSLCFAFCIFFLYKQHKILPHFTSENKKRAFWLRWEKHSFMYFCLSSLYIWTLLNIDILLARNIFLEAQSNLYAQMSIIWKVVLFMLLSIETVYYSKVLSSKLKKQSQLLLQWLSVMGIITLASLVMVEILWNTIVNLFSWPYFSLALLQWNIILYLSCIILSFLAKLLVNRGLTIVIGYMLLHILILIMSSYTIWTHSLFSYIVSITLSNMIAIVMSSCILLFSEKRNYEIL